MKLSRREAKNRMRFIQEHHYNKAEQRILDDAAPKLCGYTEIYIAYRKGAVFGFMASISILRLSRTMRRAGATVQELTDAVVAFGAATRSIK